MAKCSKPISFHIMNSKCDHTRMNCEHHDNLTGKLNEDVCTLTLHLYWESVACWWWNPVAEIRTKLKTKYIKSWIGGTLRHRDSRPYWAVRSFPFSTELSPQCSSANYRCVCQHQQHPQITVEQVKLPKGQKQSVKNCLTFFPPMTISSPSSLLQTMWGLGYNV